MFGPKTTPTEEIGCRILEALHAESRREPRDVFRRKPMQQISRELMERHGWDVLDFGRGWSLLVSEKLMDGRKRDDDFYAWPTTEGREFLRAHRPRPAWSLKRKIYLLVSCFLILVLAGLLVKYLAVLRALMH